MNTPRYLTMIALLCAAGAVAAQAPAPAPAPEAAPVAAAKSTCGKPEDHPGKNASDTRRRAWQRDVTAWQDCMKKYIETNKAQGDVYFKAANEAVEEFNKATNMWNEQIKALQ
jgi:ABC-type sugar transport system substrate-binding protein